LDAAELLLLPVDPLPSELPALEQPAMTNPSPSATAKPFHVAFFMKTPPTLFSSFLLLA
jgi:hypothetical protein